MRGEGANASHLGTEYRPCDAILVPSQSKNTRKIGPVTLLLLRHQGKKTCSPPPTSGWPHRLPILATPLERTLYLQRRFCIFAPRKGQIAKILVSVIEDPGSARVVPFLRSPPSDS